MGWKLEGEGDVFLSFITFSVQLSFQYRIVAALFSGCHPCCWYWSRSGLLEGLSQPQRAAVQGVLKAVTWFSPSMSTLEWGAAAEERTQCSDFCKSFFCSTPCAAEGDFSHKRALSFTGLCASIWKLCKNWQQLIELEILFLSQSKFLFQNKLWNRDWNRSQTTPKWMWRVYCLSSKDLCRATTWVHHHESVKKMRKCTSPQ